MATLDEKMAEIARIKAELQRMEQDESVTEEQDGDLRDTLIARYRKLKDECAPIIARMKEIQEITRAAEDEDNLERPDGQESPQGGYASRQAGFPDLLVTNPNRDPYEGLEAVRVHAPEGDRLLMQRSEIRARALDAVELEAKRGNLAHDFAEAATRKAQDNVGIGQHMLLTGSQEYQEAFRAYMENPQGEAQRAALSLTLANGGYLLPFVLDQVPVA